MSGLGIEAEAFLRAFFTGMLLCGIYEALRIFRRLIRHHPLFFSYSFCQKPESSAENFSRKKLENTGKELINLWKQGTIICIIQNHQNVRRGKDEDF